MARQAIAKQKTEEVIEDDVPRRSDGRRKGVRSGMNKVDRAAHIKVLDIQLKSWLKMGDDELREELTEEGVNTDSTPEMSTVFMVRKLINNHVRQML